MRFLAAGKLYDERGRIKLEIDRNNIELGEQILIEANIIDQSYRPDTKNEEIIIFDSLATEVTRLKLIKNEEIYSYQGYWRPNRAGTFTLYVTEDNQPNAKIASKVSVTVEQVSLEMNESSLRSKGLKQVSETTGGYFLTFDNSAQIKDILKGGTETIKIINEEATFLNPWPIFAIILLLLCVEWLLRKKSNLC